MKSIITLTTMLLLPVAVFAQDYIIRGHETKVQVEAPRPQSPSQDSEKVYDHVEQMPVFPGGEVAMLRWITDHIQYPVECQEGNIQGRVVLQFVVKKDGSIGQVKVVRPKHPALDKEAVRVIKSLPRFEPGKMNGQVVNVWNTVPITFKLQDERQDAPVIGQKVTELEIVPDDYVTTPPAVIEEETFYMDQTGGCDNIVEAKTHESKVMVEIPKPQPQEDNSEKVYDAAEQMPMFPGGEVELLRWVSSHIIYPQVCQENGIQGRVVLQFVVKKDGSIGRVKVVRPKDPDLDKEAVRVIKSLPRFEPGKMNGQAVNVWYTLPVTFKLQK